MKFKILTLFLLASFGLQAQEMYSYISDKRFKDPSDLVGYFFTPNYIEIPDEDEYDLSPGDYSFGITQNNLYVSGESIAGVYSMNTINPTEYGYKIALMNARDPRIQGHLKVILNKFAHVDALVFKRSRNDKEMIFYQAKMSKDEVTEVDAFFTDRWETKLEMPDSVWGMQLQPYFRVHMRDNVQEKLATRDSTSITFTEKITIIDKTKKKKSKKKKGKVEETSEETEGQEIAAEDVENIEAGFDEEEKKKLKIVKEYFVEVRSILHPEEGDPEAKKWMYKIKNVKEREDTQAGPDGERYQVELETAKGQSLYLYLTSERTISSFEMGDIGVRYLMRGH